MGCGQWPAQGVLRGGKDQIARRAQVLGAATCADRQGHGQKIVLGQGVAHDRDIGLIGAHANAGLGENPRAQHGVIKRLTDALHVGTRRQACRIFNREMWHESLLRVSLTC